MHSELERSLYLEGVSWVAFGPDRYREMVLGKGIRHERTKSFNIERVIKKLIVLVCSDFYNKISQTRWPKQLKFIFSWFVELEAQDQGASRVGIL